VHTQTLIIGGGQAGLALGHHLQRAGAGFAILDAHPRVGDAWRRRWDSLTLFTPRRYDGLPGLPLDGDPDGHPGKDEIAGYLAGYAGHFALPVHTGCRVTSLRPRLGGGFVAETSTGEWSADQVVVATGAFHTPSVPSFAGRLADRVVQLHSSEYRNPDQLPAGDVLVAGAGNTGVQIAGELAAHGRRVTLAYDRLGPVLPQRLLGRDIFWWFSRLGTMTLSGESRLGARIRAQNPIIGTDMRRLLRSVRRTGRIVAAQGHELRSADGTRHRADAVVWATGFRPGYPWLHVPVLDDRGAPVHRGGATSWPGLYFLGLPWQRTRGSAVLGWIGRDAEAIAGMIASAAPARAAAAVG